MKSTQWKLATLAMAAASTMLSVSAHAGATLDAIKARGQVVCGVSTGLAGFSATDSNGKFTGLDVDVCRAIAAATLGSADKVKFVPLTAQQRFTALQSGEIDVLSRNTTFTITRDASLGLHMTATTYYDGQGFMVPKRTGMKSAKQLKNQTVCVQSGTTTEKNLTDFSNVNKLNIKPVVFEKLDAVNAAYFAGRCVAYTTDASGLASIRSNEAKNPADHVILPEVISKEPLGPMVRRGDDEWFAIVKWVIYGLVEAEEVGITKANWKTMQEGDNVSVNRILGGAGQDTGKLLGLDAAWMTRAIDAVGNYGEIFARNVGPATPLNLPRGVNAQWTQGGLMYAPPLR
jgi:general L-amino acid transport system substrate-binding protein